MPNPFNRQQEPLLLSSSDAINSSMSSVRALTMVPELQDFSHW